MEVLGYLFKFIVVVFVILFTVYLFLSYEGYIELHQKEKALVEIKENLAVSSLTVERLVFSSEQLDAVDGKIIQPVRSCSYGYRVSIECVDDDVCEKNNVPKTKYEFGDGTAGLGVIKPLTLPTLMAPVLIESVVDGAPARSPGIMKITLFDSTLTHISCMVEKAYYTKTTQSTACFMSNSKNECMHPAEYPPAIMRLEGALCAVTSNPLELSDPSFDLFRDGSCKYVPDAAMNDFLYPVDAGFKGEKYLKAVPLDGNRAGAVCNPECPQHCDDLTNFVAPDNLEQAAIVVALCTDDTP